MGISKLSGLVTVSLVGWHCGVKISVYAVCDSVVVVVDGCMYGCVWDRGRRE